jgi:hypothetical protein
MLWNKQGKGKVREAGTRVAARKSVRERNVTPPALSLVGENG